ncbi:MAG: hypothetical protein ACPGO5_01530 [Patescibacteria group bacterium]
MAKLIRPGKKKENGEEKKKGKGRRRKSDSKKRTARSTKIRITSPSRIGAINITSAFNSWAYVSEVVDFSKLGDMSAVRAAERMAFPGRQRKPVFKELEVPIELTKGMVLRVVKDACFLDYIFVFIGNKYIVRLPMRRIEWVDADEPVTEIQATTNRALKIHLKF